MAIPKLRVLPRGTGRVPDYEAAASIRRYIGWKHDPTLGHPILDYDTTGVMGDTGRKTGGFVRSATADKPVEVPQTGEYIRHLRDGDLWPADADTAQIAGVKFDATFGGEYADDAQPAAPAAPAAAPATEPATETTAHVSAEEH